MAGECVGGSERMRAATLGVNRRGSVFAKATPRQVVCNPTPNPPRACGVVPVSVCAVQPLRTIAGGDFLRVSCAPVMPAQHLR